MPEFKESEIKLASAAATEVAETFLPAEHAQGFAALDGARALARLLELSENPIFHGRLATTARALAEGTQHSVNAKFAFEFAHGSFMKAVGRTPLPEHGWGCPGPTCPWDLGKPSGMAPDQQGAPVVPADLA
ncbi:MAG: hypothetical protein KYX69_12190 [Sphingomonas sp.]|uniref:hypothetical protein n=1 Tax=Sphingomonas sp. TaxID=28214 RepID=UPI002635A349|nr:hypothetical protein [Sphingomonas sp.]MDK2768464.1 hypothetical protein [Sphingomonas sp.]